MNRFLRGLSVGLLVLGLSPRPGAAQGALGTTTNSANEQKQAQEVRPPLECGAKTAASRTLSMLELATTVMALEEVANDPKGDHEAVIEAGGPSAVLGKALLEAGFTKAAGMEAHHIVAYSSPYAAEARAILKAAGIPLNDAANGVFLPGTATSPNPDCLPVHRPLHRINYYNEVNSRLRNAAKGTHRDVLAQIRREILNGTFPH